jgi:ankyrin repeat protein
MPGASIHEACSRGNVDAVRALIAADPAAVDADDEHGWRPIFHAALWRHEPVVRLLIAAGADLAPTTATSCTTPARCPATRPS